jgi:hypothetical protein
MPVFTCNEVWNTGFSSPGLILSVVGLMISDLSKEHTAFNFKGQAVLGFF